MAEVKRDTKTGQFLKGSSGNPGGRPTALAVRVLKEVVTEEDWRIIWEVGMGYAKAGSVKWAKLLAAYDSGKPIETRITTMVEDIELVWPEEDEGSPAPTP